MSRVVLTVTQTRMQILNPTPSAVYNGMIQSGYRIATGEGILSLWRGMSSVVVGAGLYISCR
jgi:solute carrier family 25 iron transporter 28/37